MRGGRRPCGRCRVMESRMKWVKQRAKRVPDRSPWTMERDGWNACEAAPSRTSTRGARQSCSSRASMVGGNPSRSAARPSLTQSMES
eukprot:3891203-Pyramimonas_sp.AAC.1